MTDGSSAQAAGQPAIQLAHLRQIQAPGLGQLLKQQLVTCQRRIAKPRREMLGRPLMAVDPRIGLPAQVHRPPHFRAILQGMTQGIGPGGQGHAFTLQAQPAVQSNGSQGHCRSTSSINPSIYRLRKSGGK
ncbi:hypothetical protein D3C84_787200 [compost metagenome]